MNEQLQQQLADYLKAILTAAQSGATFVQQQAPLVVQEKIAYGRVYETAWLVWFAALMFIAAPLLLKGTDKRFTVFMNSDRFSDDAIVTGCALWPRLIGGCVIALVGFIGASSNLDTVVKVWFAPRLYILEWAMSLARH